MPVSSPIDLRSDTVTRPAPAMFAAMAAAEVGDDQYGEDPTINKLQTRLADDHTAARGMAEIFAEDPRIILDRAKVQTNILIFDLAPGAPDAATVVAAARDADVLIFDFGPRTIRAVTRLDVTRDQCPRAATVLNRIVAR